MLTLPAASVWKGEHVLHTQPFLSWGAAIKAFWMLVDNLMITNDSLKFALQQEHFSGSQTVRRPRHKDKPGATTISFYFLRVCISICVKYLIVRVAFTCCFVWSESLEFQKKSSSAALGWYSSSPCVLSIDILYGRDWKNVYGCTKGPQSRDQFSMKTIFGAA